MKSLALIQMQPKLGDLKANLAQVLEKSAHAQKSGASMALFPELALSGYFIKDLVSEVALHSKHSALKQLCQASLKIDICLGSVWQDSNLGLSNALLYLSKGKLKAVHEKVYLPTYGLFDETRYFKPGQQGVTLVETPFGTAALLVCEDAWHAALPLSAALKGAKLLLVASSSPARGLMHGSEQTPLGITQHWRTLMGAWALTLGVHVAYCNRVGFEEGVGFWGGSFALAPDSSLLAEGPLLKQAQVVLEMNPADVRRARLAGPHLRDEKLDLNVRLFAELSGWELAKSPGPKPKSRRG
jgi:predicted amidohydrolase